MRYKHLKMITLLKLARERRGWTQAEAADRVEVDRSHFSRMENGLDKASTPVAKRIAAVFPELTRDQILFPEEYVGVPLPPQPQGVAKSLAA